MRDWNKPNCALRINGKDDILVSVLQKKYGYSAQRAREQVNRRLAEFERGQSSTNWPVLTGVKWNEVIEPGTR